MHNTSLPFSKDVGNRQALTAGMGWLKPKHRETPWLEEMLTTRRQRRAEYR
jgi:hypothetical protein